jgi:hypothetical protein
VRAEPVDDQAARFLGLVDEAPATS